jgi:hypothetical protein
MEKNILQTALAEAEHYKRAAEIAERRLERERKENASRLHDRAFIIGLIFTVTISATAFIYALASFSHWAAYGY